MKLIPRLLLLLSLIAGGLPAANDAAETALQFRETLKTVDRVVVEGFRMGGPKLGPNKRILLDVSDPQAIAMLGETIEIKEMQEICACMENVVIHFYQGKEDKFPLTLHHYYKLRGDNPYKLPGQKSPWSGDAVLTEASAAKFRAWFAEHGYDGFVNGYTSMLKAGEESARQWQLFLGLFPQSVRKQFPTQMEYDIVNLTRRHYPGDKFPVLSADEPPLPFDDPELLRALQKKRKDWLAHYPDRAQLVLDCWRGIGQLPVIGYNPGSEREEFLGYLIDAATPQEISAALERLLVADDRVWIGAYLYYKGMGEVSQERREQLISVDWLARLAKRVIPCLNPHEQHRALHELLARPAATTNRLLLEIAATGPLLRAENKDDIWGMSDELSNASYVLLRMATQRNPEVRASIVRRLPEATDAEVKLALEVALAQFDGSSAIRIEHLQSKISEVAELAWQTISKDSGAQISRETLAMLAEQSASWLVRIEAKERLQAQDVPTIDNERAKGK